jgi:hypothetical protein
LWSAFGEFVAREKLGDLVPRQLELAYVNIMPVDRIPEGDQVFVDHARELSGSRFLPAPESFEWRTSYALPTGITAYLKNGGTLEKAAAMANYASTRATQLYDRRRDEVSLDEVERIVI